MEPPKKSVKEQRIRNIALFYYSRPDIRKAIFEFGKNRETVPRYFEGFGKRPDTLSYDSDILELVKKGATSLHCSEELWFDPLEISTNLNEQQFNELRQGWDLLIDIDSKYFDYSKIYAEILIKVLKNHGIKNIGVKFSVTGDTPVLVRSNKETSLISIKEAIKKLKKDKDIEVLSLGKNKKLKFSKIYDSLIHDDEIYEVAHEHSKIPLKVTKHHSVFIFDKGKIIQKKVSDIKKGDFLVTFNSNKNLLESKDSKLDYSFQFAKNQYSKQIIKKNIKINSELMRLIGYYLAEGHITNIINQVGFTFNKNEENYINDCKELLKKITGKHISIRHPNSGSTQILIHSKEWSSFFEKYGGKSKHKHLPSFSWNLSKKLFLELLKGYIRGDGYKKGEYGVVIKSVAHQLIKELTWLCKLNGISCSLSTEQNKPHKLPQGNIFKGSFVYILKINKSELDIKEFNRKRNKYSPYPKDRTYPINGLREVYHQIKPKMFNSHRAEQMTLKKQRANLERIKKVIAWFKNYKSNNFSEESQEIIFNYESLYSSDVGVIKIKSIKKIGKEKVYDLSVEDTESFFGNDYPLLLHNSGSKGFHVIVPWNAFPKELSGQQTKDMFPEWPRIICQYLNKQISNELKERILDLDTNHQSNKDQLENYCIQCNGQSLKTNKVYLKCSGCKSISETFEETIKRKRKLRCPNCLKEMYELKKEPILYCQSCNINSATSPNKFKERIKTQSIDADIVLVSPRHLFRMPYSLHEKTSMASVVIDPEKISDFDIKDAFPLKISQPKNFLPDSEPGEATSLLIRALESQPKESEQIHTMTNPNEHIIGRPQQSKKQYTKITITKFEEKIYPPVIQSMLKGMKSDGRKRGLFILLNFFRSLNMPQEEIDKTIQAWNEKNYEPLKLGYVKAQLKWFARNPPKMPPNYDKSYYREIGFPPTQKEIQSKNPVSFTIKRYLFFQKNNKS